MPRKSEPDEFTIDVSRYGRDDSRERSEALVLAMPDGKLTHTEIRVQEQALEKALLLRVEAEITLAGQDFLTQIDRHTFASFDDTLTFIRERFDADRPDEDQRNLDAFRKIVTQMAAEHLLGASKLGAAQIAQIMQRPISTDDTRSRMERFLTLLGR